MKIVSMVSSYRKNGNTERLVRLIEEEMTRMAAEKNMPLHIERISLGHYNLQFCRGCRVCFDKGEAMCPLQDDLLAIRDKIADADGIILASPVYVEDINGIMKNWIDRMAFNCHRPAYAGKAAIIITTSGGGASNHALRTMKAALCTWGFHVAGQGKFRTGGAMKTDELTERYRKEIRRIASRLLEVKTLKPSFYSLVAFKVQQSYWQKAEKSNNTVDYAYWDNKKWLEPCCDFYSKHKAGWIKVKMARWVGSIVAVFFA